MILHGRIMKLFKFYNYTRHQQNDFVVVFIIIIIIIIIPPISYGYAASSLSRCESKILNKPALVNLL